MVVSGYSDFIELALNEFDFVISIIIFNQETWISTYDILFKRT